MQKKKKTYEMAALSFIPYEHDGLIVQATEKIGLAWGMLKVDINQ